MAEALEYQSSHCKAVKSISYRLAASCGVEHMRRANGIFSSGISTLASHCFCSLGSSKGSSNGGHCYFVTRVASVELFVRTWCSCQRYHLSMNGPILPQTVYLESCEFSYPAQSPTKRSASARFLDPSDSRQESADISA